MKKPLLRLALASAFLLWLAPLAAQPVLSRQVVASAGGSQTVDGILFQFTVGEPAVMTFIRPGVMLSQGFQQPEVLPHHKPGPGLVQGFKVYPSPASTVATAAFDLLADAKVNLQLVNTAGQVMMSRLLSYGAGKVTIPLHVGSLAAGVYSVVLRVSGDVFIEQLIVQ